LAPAGFEYLPLSAVQSEAVQELNSSVSSGGASGDFLAAKHLVRSGRPVALVISASGAGDNANREDFVHGMVIQEGADPRAVTQNALPDGRRLISFTRNPITTAITFSGCYALVAEAGDARVAWAVASVL
jgi:hypothetical protein